MCKDHDYHDNDTVVSLTECDVDPGMLSSILLMCTGNQFEWPQIKSFHSKLKKCLNYLLATENLIITLLEWCVTVWKIALHTRKVEEMFNIFVLLESGELGTAHNVLSELPSFSSIDFKASSPFEFNLIAGEGKDNLCNDDIIGQRLIFLQKIFGSNSQNVFVTVTTVFPELSEVKIRQKLAEIGGRFMFSDPMIFDALDVVISGGSVVCAACPGCSEHEYPGMDVDIFVLRSSRQSLMILKLCSGLLESGYVLGQLGKSVVVGVQDGHVVQIIASNSRTIPDLFRDFDFEYP